MRTPHNRIILKLYILKCLTIQAREETLMRSFRAMKTRCNIIQMLTTLVPNLQEEKRVLLNNETARIRGNRRSLGKHQVNYKLQKGSSKLTSNLGRKNLSSNWRKKLVQLSTKSTSGGGTRETRCIKELKQTHFHPKMRTCKNWLKIVCALIQMNGAAILNQIGQVSKSKCLSQQKNQEDIVVLDRKTACLTLITSQIRKRMSLCANQWAQILRSDCKKYLAMTNHSRKEKMLVNIRNSRKCLQIPLKSVHNQKSWTIKSQHLFSTFPQLVQNKQSLLRETWKHLLTKQETLTDKR